MCPSITPRDWRTAYTPPLPAILPNPEPAVFAYFERLVNPYPEGSPEPPPKELLPFLWTCTRGVRRYLAEAGIRHSDADRITD